MLEKPEENPFLPDFYSDRKRWALQTQLTFLLTRHRQYMELSQMDLFQRAVVTDYIFDKDAIFARLTLNEREFDLYSRIAEQLAADIVTPDLVVYLQSSPERLLTNIRIRDIRYEREIDIEYLE